MLPPFIIDQIREREERERRIGQQPFLELPIYQPRPREKSPEESDRGVVIIDLRSGV